MLGRAAVPLLRPRTRFPPAVRLWTVSSLHQTRCYAKDRRSKSNNDHKSPSTPPISRQQRPSQGAFRAQAAGQEQRFSKDKESAASEHSDLQPELDTPADGRLNSPDTAEALHSRSKQHDVDRTISSATNPPQENSQPEFDTLNKAGNTTSSAYQSQQGEEALDGLYQEAEAESKTGSQQPLPDLTQGIPSTLDAELREAHSRQQASTASLNITEDPAEAAASGSGRGGEGLPRSAYISSNEKKKNNIIKYTYLVMVGGILGYGLYLGRNWDSLEEEHNHQEAPSGWGFGLFWNRVKARLASTLDYYNEPAFPTLLPKHDPNVQPPMCLVLSLEDLLVHQEWTRERGWRIAKRPGVDYFLRYLSQYYELVLFTTQPSSMADQVIRKLDPYRIIQWPLFREATLYKDGGYVKDLSYLNRDLSKVMLVDTEPGHARNQPENAIILPKWTGDPHDQTLVQFIPFLEYVATMGFDDTRAVLKSFDGKFIPAEFGRREKLLREKFEAKMAEERKKRPKRTVGGLGSLFGVKNQPSPDGLENSAEAFEQGKMLWDQIRERGQKQYELIDKQIREEGQKWLDDMAAEEKKFQEEQMKSMKTGFFGYFAGGGGEEAK